MKAKDLNNSLSLITSEQEQVSTEASSRGEGVENTSQSLDKNSHLPSLRNQQENEKTSNLSSPFGGHGAKGSITFGYQWADPSTYKLISEFAKENRSTPTPAEEKLWTLLKTKELEGHKFRRQHIIGSYITDFVCLDKRLVIEIDGLIHQLPENKEADKIRTQWLNYIGFKVIRFINDEVLNKTDETIQTILIELNERKGISSALYNSPSPHTAEQEQVSTEAPSRGEGVENTSQSLDKNSHLPSLRNQQENENTSNISSPLGGHGATKAMILAAGLGTRLKPFTDKHPKALAIVNGKTILQRNIEYLATFGINEVIVNVHHFADQVINLIKINKGFGSRISFSDETAEVLDTGGGIKKAAWFFEEDKAPFVVMNVDILTDLNLGDMIAQHKKNNPLATLAVTSRITSRYFLFDEYNHLCGWKNDKTGEQRMSTESKKCLQKAFSGIHIISPEIFPLMKGTGKFSIVDEYLELAKTHTISSFDHSNTKFIDVGKTESILRAEEMFD
jgi:MurNAc alpha-1-phosphate uridylyltransferase